MCRAGPPTPQYLSILCAQNSQNRRGGAATAGNLTSNSTSYTGTQSGATGGGGAVAGTEVDQHLPQLRVAEKTPVPVGKNIICTHKEVIL